MLSSIVNRAMRSEKKKTLGVVEKWNDGRGFGFLEVEGLAGQVFMHITALHDKNIKALAPGQRVYFQLLETDRGYKAVNAELSQVES